MAGTIVAMLLFQNCQKSEFLVITGVVRDSITHMPIEDAAISADGKLFWSESDGTFTIEGVRPGKSTFWINKRSTYYSTAKSVTISDGRVNKVDIYLKPFEEPEISTGKAIVTGPNSAVVTGKLNLKSGHSAQQFGHCWSTSNTSPRLENSLDYTSNPGGTGEVNFTSTLSGLESEKIYYICAYVKTNPGNIVYGNTVAFKISDDKEDIDNGLLFHFPFNGNHLDITGNYNLYNEMGNPSYFNDRFGISNNACYFSSGKWYGGRLPELNEFAVSLWFYKSGSWENSEQHLIQIGDDYSGNVFDNIFYITQGTSPQNFNAGMRTGSFDTDYRISVNSSPSLNKWHHVVAQRKGSSFYLYIDGSLINSISCTTAVLPSTRYSNIGGAWIGLSGNYQQFVGGLDEVRLYNRALSIGEIYYLSTH